MVQRTPADDDPTIEERSVDFDGASTDRLDGTDRLRVVTARERGKGGIGFDERGRARWQWNTEIGAGSDASGTFNELKALENPALALEGDAPQASEPSAKSGYDPYATGVFVKPKVRRKP